MKIAYTIDGQSFPIQSDLIKYIQAILRSYIPPAQLKPGDNTFPISFYGIPQRNEKSGAASDQSGYVQTSPTDMDFTLNETTEHSPIFHIGNAFARLLMLNVLNTHFAERSSNRLLQSSRRLLPIHIELYEPRHGIGKILPPDIENDWAEWHREHAILRVISAEANAWVHL